MTRLFDPLAADYDAARPGYPDDLFSAVERLAGKALAGARVVDIGAGTGIASRELLVRGAHVLAVDVATGMLAFATRREPHPLTVVADGAALPLRNGWADLVVYAQAWHWMQVPDATAEAARVLRPGGALAVWWNDVDAAEASWWQAQQQRLEAMNPNYDREYRTRDYAGELRATRCFAEVAEWQGHWVRSLDLDGYERWLRSKSYVAALGPRLPEFLAAERASLAAAFPSGLVEEPFRVTLCVARRPQC